MGYDVKQKVKEPLSFHLESVPWGEALEMVLRSAHLWYSQDDGIIRVDTEENLRKEDLDRSNAARQMEEVMPLTTRIVEVVYANADELKRAVEKIPHPAGVIDVDQRTNSLVVTDIAPRVESAVEMIQHLDSQTPQIEIVAKLVDVDARYSRDLGMLWSAGGLHNAQGLSAEGGGRIELRDRSHRRRPLRPGPVLGDGLGAPLRHGAAEQGQHHLQPPHDHGEQPRGADPGREEDPA